jgi:hypothetical protein
VNQAEYIRKLVGQHTHVGKPVSEPWTVRDRVVVFGAFGAVLLFSFSDTSLSIRYD